MAKPSKTMNHFYTWFGQSIQDYIFITGAFEAWSFVARFLIEFGQILLVPSIGVEPTHLCQYASKLYGKNSVHKILYFLKPL